MHLEFGQIVEAEVFRTEVYGIYLKYAEETLLVLVPEVSWTKRIQDCRTVASIGDRIRVCILGPATDRSYYGASIRQAVPDLDPWKNLADLFVGAVRRATITARLLGSESHENTSHYIANIKPGVDGLLMIGNANTHLRIGQEVECIIVSINSDEKKMILKLLPIVKR